MFLASGKRGKKTAEIGSPKKNILLAQKHGIAIRPPINR